MPDFRGEAAADLVDYVEAFYIRSRRHSTLGYKSPLRFLQDGIKTRHLGKMAA
jgi:putative transposase